MNTIENDIKVIDNLTSKALDLLIGNQNVIARFVYCAIQKLNKVNSTIQLLYPKLSPNSDLEFSIGILLRAVLMDCIQANHLAFIIQNDVNKSSEDVFADLRKKSISFTSDGIENVINKLNSERNIDIEKTELIIQNILNLFPDVVNFNTNENRYSKKKEYKFKLFNLYNDSKSEQFPEREDAYKMYSFYSKYDHLSNFTTVIQNSSDYSLRKNKIDHSIKLFTLHLRLLLFIGIVYGEKNDLNSCLKVLDDYIINSL